MKNEYQQSMALLEALEQVNESILLQAFTTDTPEKFHGLGKIRKITKTQSRTGKGIPKWLGVAACLTVILTLAVSPWVFSALLPMFSPSLPTEPTEPSLPPTTGFSELYDSSVPPQLLVYGTRQSIWPLMTGYDWYYYPQPGSTEHNALQALNPLSAEMAENIPWLTTEESTLLLKFQADHSSIQVRCWEAGKQGDTDAYEAYQVAPCSNQSLQLKPGSYIYEVNAEWYPMADYQGSATYVFGVTANFESQKPERNITIRSGDMQLSYAVEKLNRGIRYDDAANRWVDEWDSGGYWTLVEAAQHGAPLPTLVFSGDLQVNLGANGTLTDIRVYFSRDSATPGVYMFAETPGQVKALPAGQWYILMCVTWEGRFIEHQNACESYYYEYVFMLDVPQAEIPTCLWEFDEESGTLTVSDCDAIPDFTYADQWTTPPWQAHREAVQHIVVADGITKIGSYAFYGMPNLQTATLPGSLKEISDCAFQGAHSLTDIRFPNALEKIGDYAFDDCKALPEILLPEGLNSIGQDAFRFCTLPESLIIPASVTSLGIGAFRHCTGLKEVTVLGNADRFLYTFEGCTALQIIRFCGNAPASLGDITFEDRVICYYPSHNSTWTDEILNTANLYYTAWFASDDPLSERISENATSGQCGRTAYWELKEGVLTISGTGDVTYMGWENLRSEIKKVVIEDGITNITDGSFYQCTNLTSVIIPDSVTYIGFRAFYECKKLKSVTLPENLQSLGDYAFMHCESITAITIPEKLTVIPRMAFCGCVSLKEINLPDSLTEITNGAFQRCTALKTIHFPASLQVLGDYAFSGCTGLKKLYFYGDAPGVSNFTFEGVTATAYYPPGNVSWISGGMGFHSGNITEKPDPDQCTHDFGEWVITKEATRLEEGSRQRTCSICGYKESEILPPTAYEKDPPKHPELGQLLDRGKAHGVIWTLYENGVLTIFGTGSMEPAERFAWEGYRSSIRRIILEEGVTTIANSAFAGMVNLLIVELPDTLTQIGEYAFSGCNHLQSIEIPGSVHEIQDYAFSKCTHLGMVYFLGDAPNMANNIFHQDTIYAYYDKNNTTWIGKLGNYGGLVTWVGRSDDPASSRTIYYRKDDLHEA